MLDGDLSLRKASVLLDGLPPESRWWSRIRRRPEATTGGDPDAIRWGALHELLAGVIDACNMTAHAIWQVNSKGTVPAPKPYPRPRVGKPDTSKGMSQRNRDQMKAWADALNHRKQQEATDGN